MEIRSWATKLNGLKIVFTLSSSTYCAIHWLLVHNFSVYVLSAALGFGAIAATLVAWLSGPVPSSSASACLSAEIQRSSYQLPRVRLRHAIRNRFSVAVGLSHEDKVVDDSDPSRR